VKFIESTPKYFLDMYLSCKYLYKLFLLRK